MLMLKKVVSESTYEKNGKEYHFKNYILIDKENPKVQVNIKCAFKNDYALLDLLVEEE